MLIKPVWPRRLEIKTESERDAEIWGERNRNLRRDTEAEQRETGGHRETDADRERQREKGETTRQTKGPDSTSPWHNMHLNNNDDIYWALTTCKYMLHTFMWIIVLDSHNHPMRCYSHSYFKDRTLRHREVTQLTPSHTASGGEAPDLRLNHFLQ